MGYAWPALLIFTASAGRRPSSVAESNALVVDRPSIKVSFSAEGA